MKAGWWVLALTVVLFPLLGTDAAASRLIRDASGDAMQRYDSRMMASPLTNFSSRFGIYGWPFIYYPPALPMTIVNIQIQIPELNHPPTPPPTPPARPKFWTARCGVFIELEVSSTMNLMEEEAKPCAR
jgi:hypothetical protein